MRADCRVATLVTVPYIANVAESAGHDTVVLRDQPAGRGTRVRLDPSAAPAAALLPACPATCCPAQDSHSGEYRSAVQAYSVTNLPHTSLAAKLCTQLEILCLEMRTCIKHKHSDVSPLLAGMSFCVSCCSACVVDGLQQLHGGEKLAMSHLSHHPLLRLLLHDICDGQPQRHPHQHLAS